MTHVLDVGANFGSFGKELAQRNPLISVHLIEPVPDIAALLRKQLAADELSNAFVYQVALGIDNREAQLHLNSIGDRGTTSLLSFDSGKIAADPYWSLRSDLRHDGTIDVQVYSLKSFMVEHGIESIDFIKIDVQGLDLDVLASAGDRISVIRAGMLEVTVTEINALYVGEQQNLRTTLNFLEENGFKIMAVKPNDPACNEVNVFFSRCPQTWDADIDAWGLRGLPAFDGKHYWHAYSNSPLYSDDLNRQLLTENQRLLERINELDTDIARLNQRILLQDHELNNLKPKRSDPC